jgi:hypothetical protein
MTRDEHIERFVEMFPNLPNPEHNPRQFQHCLRLYKYLYKQGLVREKSVSLPDKDG